MPNDLIDRIFLKVSITRALFNCFMLIFVLTAIATLAGLIKLLPMEPKYLDKLFEALVLEVVAGVIGMFTATFGERFLKETERDLKVQLVFRDKVDITKLPNPINDVDYTLIDPARDIDTINDKGIAFREGHSYYMELKKIPTDKLLNVVVEIGSKKYQGAQHLKTYPLELKAR